MLAFSILGIKGMYLFLWCIINCMKNQDMKYSHTAYGLCTISSSALDYHYQCAVMHKQSVPYLARRQKPFCVKDEKYAIANHTLCLFYSGIATQRGICCLMPSISHFDKIDCFTHFLLKFINIKHDKF